MPTDATVNGQLQAVQPPGDLSGRTGPIPDGLGPEAIDPGPRSVLGAPLPHESARAHVTGTAAFLDDTPLSRGELTPLA